MNDPSNDGGKTYMYREPQMQSWNASVEQQVAPQWPDTSVKAPMKPPVSFYLASVLGGIVIVSGVIGLIAGFFTAGKATITADGLGQLGSIAIMPAILFYMGQLALMLVGLYLVIREIRRWNTGAIVAGVLLAPILLVFASGAVLRMVTGESGRALPGAPVVPILVAAFYWLFAGVIACNDIRYRKPTMQGMR